MIVGNPINMNRNPFGTYSLDHAVDDLCPVLPYMLDQITVISGSAGPFM